MSSATADDRGVIVSCKACSRRNRLPYTSLGQEGRCGFCKAPLGPPEAPVEVPSAEAFDRLVATSALPVVVDFWAPWCGPCRMMAPEIDKVAAAHPGEILVVKVNTEELSDLGERLGIRSIPTLAVFKGGQELARDAGARPAGDIERFVFGALR